MSLILFFEFLLVTDVYNFLTIQTIDHATLMLEVRTIHIFIVKLLCDKQVSLILTTLHKIMSFDKVQEDWIRGP